MYTLYEGSGSGHRTTLPFLRTAISCSSQKATYFLFLNNPEVVGFSHNMVNKNNNDKVEDTTAQPWIITNPLDSVSLERVGAEYSGHMVEIYGYFEMNRSSEHCTFVAYSVKKMCCD